MMRLLGIKANHYKNCDDEIFINFIPNAKKTEEDKTYELYEVDNGLYTFSTNAIIGKNASGKTSVLKLIDDVYTILESFQLEDEIISISGTQLEITFYHDKKIYRYITELERNLELGKSLSFKNEKIYVGDYYKSKVKSIFSDDFYREETLDIEYPDIISKLFYILKERKNYAYFYDDSDDVDSIYHFIYNMYETGKINFEYWQYILRLFDDNIRNLVEIKNDVFRLEYLNEVKDLSAKELFSMISRGTTKGIVLYTFAILSLIEGNTLIIDEIENHFHKTLVENLISLYKDKSVNKHGATLIFSTHYNELLDMFARNDNIWITKSKEKISLTNMYKDYAVRNDLLKSKKFYDDTFGTAVDYTLLMTLKRKLINE